METPPALSLKLEKQASSLHGLMLTEIIPLERVKAIIKMDELLLPSWDNTPHQQMVARDYANELLQLEEYKNKHNSKNGGVLVKYFKPRLGFGRAYPQKSLGLTCLRRKIRNTLVEGVYYDFDLKNAQPSILRHLCISNNIPCPCLIRYCEEREQILVQVQTAYGVDRDTAKELFIRICFLGTFNGWCYENKLGTKIPFDFIALFEIELRTIAERLRTENPALYKSVADQKTKSGTNHSPYNTSPDTKVLGSFFAIYNQEYESRVVEKLLFHLINHTNLLKHPTNAKLNVGTYEYDGIKLLARNVEAFGGPEAVVALLNEQTRALTGFNLEWVNKEIEGAIPLGEALQQVAEEETPDQELIADMKKITDAISKNDTGIIETLMKILPNHYLYLVDKKDTSKGDWVGWNGIRWVNGDAPLRLAIIYEVEKYWNKLLEKWNRIFQPMEFGENEEKPANYLVWVNGKAQAQLKIYELKGSKGLNSCVSVAKTLMTKDFEFDTNPDLIGFNNGVFDIVNEVFRPYQFDDYITMSCGYDYTPQVIGTNIHIGEDDEGTPLYRQLGENDITPEFEASATTIINAFTQIMPDKEVRDYLFAILSTGMSGRAIEKFFVFNGAGRNGKGLTNEAMEMVLGDYFVNVSPVVFCEDQKKKTSSGANPELAKLNKKRYVVAKEPSRDLPLQNSVIKDLTGGGNITARDLYSSKTKVTLCLTLVLECNDKPNFSEAPKDADIERVNDLLFGSKFSSDPEEWCEASHIYPVNADLKADLKTSLIHRNTMANILIANLIGVKKEGYNMDAFKPESVRQRSIAYLQNSYDIHNIFTDLFEERVEERAGEYVDWSGKAKDEDWTVAKVVGKIRGSLQFRDLSKAKQKEYTAKKVEEFLTTNRFYKPILYAHAKSHSVRIRNWRLKPAEKLEDTDEEV
jgi:hypothetical protein